MADTLVASNPFTTLYDPRGLWGPFWISPQIGAKIYVDSNQDICATKTTDGGATYGTPVVLGTATVHMMAAFFDRQVVGDNGDKVHVCYVDGTADLLGYGSYDIGDNAWTGPVTTAFVASNVSSNLKCYVTKTRSGHIHRGAVNSTLNSLSQRSTDGGSTFNTITSIFESNASDAVLGAYCDTGDDDDAAVFFWDVSANAVSVKIYASGANNWTETAIASSMTQSNPYHSWATDTRHVDGHSLLAVWNAVDVSTADLMTFDCNLNSVALPTITPTTNVVTNLDNAAQVGILVDQDAEDVYVTYLRGSAWLSTVDCVSKKSTDGMSTWGSETAYTADAADDLRMVSVGALSAAGGGRFQPVVFNDDLDGLYNNLDNDVEIPAVIAPINITPTPVAIPIVIPAPSISVDRIISPSPVTIVIIIPSVTIDQNQSNIKTWKSAWEVAWV